MLNVVTSNCFTLRQASVGQCSWNTKGDGPSPFWTHGSPFCHYGELGDSAKLLFDSYVLKLFTVILHFRKPLVSSFVKNFSLLPKWTSFPTSCAEVHVNSKHKPLLSTTFRSVSFWRSYYCLPFSCPNHSCREAAAFFSIPEQSLHEDSCFFIKLS